VCWASASAEESRDFRHLASDIVSTSGNTRDHEGLMGRPVARRRQAGDVREIHPRLRLAELDRTHLRHPQAIEIAVKIDV